MVVHGPYPIGESRVMREASAAAAAGWDVDVVAMNNGGEPSSEVIDGIRVFRLPPLRGSRAGLLAMVREYVGFTILAALRVAWLHLRRRYRVVQVHNPPDFLLATGLLPRISGARLVFDVHDFATELFLLRHPTAAKSLLHRVLEWIEQTAVRAADAVVTVNEPYRRALVRKGVSENRLVVVLNSLDERLLPEERQPRDKRFVVIHHGTVNEHYGVDVLVKSFASLRAKRHDALLEIYGTGDAVPNVRGLVSELGLEEHVRLDGVMLPQRQVLHEVTRASVGVVANLAIDRNHAVLPIKLLEYVALGVPVVSSDLAGIREYFGDEHVLFYPAGDTRALAAALYTVARDPAGADERAQAAYDQYQAYRWDVYAGRYAELLERLAA